MWYVHGMWYVYGGTYRTWSPRGWYACVQFGGGFVCVSAQQKRQSEGDLAADCGQDKVHGQHEPYQTELLCEAQAV